MRQFCVSIVFFHTICATDSIRHQSGVYNYSVILFLAFEACDSLNAFEFPGRLCVLGSAVESTKLPFKGGWGKDSLQVKMFRSFCNPRLPTRSPTWLLLPIVHGRQEEDALVTLALRSCAYTLGTVLTSIA